MMAMVLLNPTLQQSQCVRLPFMRGQASQRTRILKQRSLHRLRTATRVRRQLGRKLSRICRGNAQNEDD